MSDPAPPHAVSRWLKANALASVGLSITLLGSVSWASYVVIHWIDAQEYQVARLAEGRIRNAEEIASLQASMRSVDGRLNAHTAADAEMKARLDVIEALARYNTERITSPPLREPYAPSRKGSGP